MNPLTDRAIQVGDLVQIVRPSPCCGADRHLGQPFVVSALSILGMASHSGRVCSGTPPGTVVAVDAKDGRGAPISILKRIPRLDELEGQRTEENLKLPTKEPA